MCNLVFRISVVFRFSKKPKSQRGAQEIEEMNFSGSLPKAARKETSFHKSYSRGILKCKGIFCVSPDITK